MGKTLDLIFPLAGGPKAVLATAEIAAAFIIGGPIGSALAAFGVGQLAQTLQKGPPSPQAIAFPYRSPTPERQSGYGRARLSGAYMLYDLAPDGTSVDILALHDGLIDGYEVFYLNDDRVKVDPSGWIITRDRPDGRYSSDGTALSDKVAIQTRLGLGTETPYTSIAGVAVPGWTTAHRGDGIASLCLGCRTPKLTYYDTIYPNGLPLPSAIARLQLVWDPRDGTQNRTDPTTWKWSANPVLCVLHYLLFAPNGMGLDYTFRIAPALSDWIAAANDCDIATPIKNVSSQLSASIDVDSHTVTSVNLYKVDGLEVGATINIGATLGNEETFTVTSISGLTVGLSGHLANDHAVDELVEWLSDPSTPAMEPRYATGGVYKHTSAPGDVLKTLLASFDGFMAPRGDGSISIKSGRYYTPTVTLGPDAIVADDIQHFQEEESATNVFVVKYTSPVHNYTTVEADQWREEDDIAARGVERSSDLTLNWVQSLGQARRLAKRAGARAVAPLRGTITTNLAGMEALGERYIQLQLPEISSLADTPIEITGKATIDLSSMTLTFPFIVADPDIDDWDPFIEEGAPPGGYQGASLVPLPAPTITGVTPDFSTVSAGAGGVRFNVVVAALGRNDLSFALRWKVHTATYWTEQGFEEVDDTSGLTLPTGFVPTATSIDIQAAYAAGDGRQSPWSATWTQSSATDTTVPDTLTGLAVASWGASLNVIANAVPRATSYRWRFYKSDGTTLIATYTSASPSFYYQNAQASVDGVQRAYVVKACGINTAGAGTEQTISASLAAPTALAGVSATGGATQGQGLFTANGSASYAMFYSSTSGFSPSTQGSMILTGSSPAYVNGLPAGTYYAKVAAVDLWSANPAMLNLSSEVSFTITTGGGATPSGGGGGGSGGGYIGNPRPAIP